MFIPSEEATKTMIHLLSTYSHDDSISKALNLNYVYTDTEKFLENYFVAQADYSEEFKDIITEFFFRIMKYRKYLEAIALNFFERSSNWKNQSPEDMSTCLVFLYLLVIELNEFSLNKIRELLISVNGRKAIALLIFLKRKNIVAKLYEWGVEIWDVEYVKSVLENIIKKPMFQELYDAIRPVVPIKEKNKKKRLTVPVGPKCLSRPRKPLPAFYCLPRSTRTYIPVLIKRSKIPDTTYRAPFELQRLEMARLKHKEKAEELYWEAQEKAYRCATLEKSDKFKAVIEEIEKERLFVPFKRYSSKQIKTKPIKSPKKTHAVVLREGARLLKLEEEEIKKYEYLASGGFNTDQITELEEEVREGKLRQQLEDIERKRLECFISYEEAILAKQKYLKQKKENAEEFKKERENWMKQLEDWRVEEQIRIREAFEKGKALEKNAKEAVESLKEEKYKLALETMEESRALKERRLKEKEEDLQRKIHLIKEIKALQSFGEVKKKFVKSEGGNLGLLCEMSIAELKERLFIMRVEVQDELEKKRAEFKKRRDCRKEVVDSYQELIESHKRLVEEQKKYLEEEEIAKREKKMKEVRRCSSCLDDLRLKLYEKRRQRLKQ